jgi:hypothetical protein
MKEGKAKGMMFFDSEISRTPRKKITGATRRKEWVGETLDSLGIFCGLVLLVFFPFSFIIKLTGN